MPVIYIRHADDDGDPKAMDKDISSRGRERAIATALHLVQRYGYPKTIYYCPLKRTKKTMKTMMKALNGSSPHRIHRHEEPSLGRFFTSSDMKDQKIMREVEHYGRRIIIGESKGHFKRRIVRYADSLRGKREVIWCVTHGYVIKKIAKHLGHKIPSVDYCQWLEM